MSSEFGGGGNGEGADGELEELEAVGGVSGLGVSGVGRVEGEDTVPWGGHGASSLQGHGNEVGLGDVGLEIRESVGEVGLGHLFYGLPFVGGVGFLAEEAPL